MSKSITVSVSYSISHMTDDIAARISNDLAQKINRKLLDEVCENLFNTADVELVRDIFEAIRLDPKIQDRVVAIRAARRIGAK
jgi:predicted house-cleaning noncanonical NTP pyrophosphatase (MazG superfamily)